MSKEKTIGQFTPLDLNVDCVFDKDLIFTAPLRITFINIFVDDCSGTHRTIQVYVDLEPVCGELTIDTQIAKQLSVIETGMIFKKCTEIYSLMESYMRFSEPAEIPPDRGYELTDTNAEILNLRDHAYAILNSGLFFLSDWERQYIEKVIREANKRQNRPGYVYLLRSVSGHYKIGRTKNPDNRMATFSVKLPFEVEYEHLIKTDDMNTLEDNLHERFAHRHVNGEWYALLPEDVGFIKVLGVTEPSDIEEMPF